MNGRKILAMLIALVMVITTGCSGQNGKVDENSTKISNTNNTIQSDTEKKDKEKTEKQNFKNSTPKNDTDAGLKVTKIDTAETELDERQKDIIKYFDNDYFYGNPEAMRRYPQIFEGAQVELTGSVLKVVSQQGNDYELIVSRATYGVQEFDINDCIILRGTATDGLLLEGDDITIYGRNSGIATINVDGSSITLPVINAVDVKLLDEERFDYTFVKSIAKTVFGENIEVRPADIVEGFEGCSGYIATLDNQSNAKFSKYYLSSEKGEISDASIDYFDGMNRYIEFAADLKNFYLISYDYVARTFTLECYDPELTCIWKREFEGIDPPASEGGMNRIYDYTKNNFYIILNNELHIIDSSTGEDTFEPKYVGGKVAVKKLKDGILLVASGEADAIMKVNLEGSVIWKTSVEQHIINMNSFQTVENRLILSLYCENNDYYYVLDGDDGEVIMSTEVRF